MNDLPGKRHDERRRAPRTPLCLRATVECDAWMGVCFTKDISESGVFLISQRLPTVAAGFSIELQLPIGPGQARLRGVVMRVQPDGPRGFGLEWKDLKEGERAVLQSLWGRWEQAFPVQRA